MLWGKKKSYNLVQSTNKQKKAPATNGFYTKVNSSKKNQSVFKQFINKFHKFIKRPCAQKQCSKKVKNSSKIKKIL